MIRDGGVPENAEKFTHAPHARRGFFPICRETHLLYFYSRASCEARHSIPQIFDGMPNFYSRASCEARQWQVRIKRRRKTFLLTRLMRGATDLTAACIIGVYISTHAPHARRDRSYSCMHHWSIHFYSRASCEARPIDAIEDIVDWDFYSRASCEARRILNTWKVTL